MSPLHDDHTAPCARHRPTGRRGRRPAKLAEIVAQCGGGHAIAAGAGLVQPLAAMEPDRWLEIFGVNVIGANLVTGAALDHLADDGIVAFVSSRTVNDVNAHFAAYSASKAALDQCIATWRVEHPHRRFVRIVMGNAQPTEFATHMGEPETVGAAVTRWIEQGIDVTTMMNTDDVGAALVAALATALDHPAIDSSELRFDARTSVPNSPRGDR